MRKLTAEEIALHKAAGGRPMNYDNITVVDKKPTVKEVRAAAAKAGVDMSGYSDAEIQSVIDGVDAMSLPNGKIYMGTEGNNKPLVAHETEHQGQYQNNDTKKTFEQLVKEAQVPDRGAYETPGTLEYESQQVENEAKKLYKSGWSFKNGNAR